MDATEKLAVVLVGLADSTFRGYSPLYDRIARAWADDPEVLGLLSGLVRPTETPIRVFAAVHYLTRCEPELALGAVYRGEVDDDPWPLFRSLVVERADDVASLVRTRTIQTNEVGRSAVLVPAFTWIDAAFGGRPLSLIEIGPSAGLNLLFDRFSVSYSDGRHSGDPDSPVRLTCEVIGDRPPPLPDRPLPIATRRGVDLAPVDVLDHDATTWLEACVWPDVPGRLERLRAAIGIATGDPPELERGNVLDRLGPLLDAIPAEHVPVVFSTWAIAYLDRDGRAAVHELASERGRRRDLVLVNSEGPRIIPWIEPDRPPGVEEGTDASLLGASVWLDGDEQRVALAWTHAHGQWLDWMTADP